MGYDVAANGSLTVDLGGGLGRDRSGDPGGGPSGGGPGEVTWEKVM